MAVIYDTSVGGGSFREGEWGTGWKMFVDLGGYTRCFRMVIKGKELRLGQFVSIDSAGVT